MDNLLNHVKRLQSERMMLVWLLQQNDNTSVQKRVMRQLGIVSGLIEKYTEQANLLVNHIGG
jgi:hypothetical protein